MIYNVSTLSDLMYTDLEDGYHQVITFVDGQSVTLQVEIKNYYDNVNYNISDSLGDDVPDARMLILKYHKDLSIQAGTIFRPKVRKRGMLVLCLGTLYNAGTMSMTARGAYAVGQNIYVLRHNNILYSIAANGGNGGAPTLLTTAGQAPGNAGYDGTSVNNATFQQTGGGGAGGAYSMWANKTFSGSGSAGTSFSGGSGGGGVSGYPWADFSTPSANAGMNGGPGGAGYSAYGSYYVGGGAGNPGGSFNANGSKGPDGTGGLLLVIAYNIKLGASATFESMGSQGGSYVGGGSGGGIVNIYCNKIIDKTVTDLYVATTVFGGYGGPGYAGGGNGGTGYKLVVNQVNFYNFLLQVGDDLYTLNETAYGTKYPETLDDLKIFKSTSDISSLSSSDVYDNATSSKSKLVQVMNILKNNDINNIRIIKINK